MQLQDLTQDLISDSATNLDSSSLITTASNEQLQSVLVNIIESVDNLNGLNMDIPLIPINKSDSIIEESNMLKPIIDSVIQAKQILVVSVDANGDCLTLFEGISSLTKSELKAEYGENITVYHQQLYTTALSDQTYDEAILDINNIHKLCYTREEFIAYLSNAESEVSYDFITYSHKDLKRQHREVNKVVKPVNITINKIKPKKVVQKRPKFSLFLFTSLSELTNGLFPINGLSDIQISNAKKVLEVEDYYKYEHVLEEGESLSIKEQQQAILFIVGTPAANDSYIKMSNLRWITELETGESVKGLIKNNINNAGIQVYMLRLNVWDKRQSDVFVHCNYNPYNSATK